MQPQKTKFVGSHVPKFISNVPWYVGGDVQEQSNDSAPVGSGESPAIGQARPPMAVKRVRKGACGNCGSSDHKTKECVERPRKQQSSVNSNNNNGGIMNPDRKSSSSERLGGTEFEAKRDRWNGYDPSMQKDVIQAFTSKQKASSSEAKVPNKISTDNAAKKSGEQFDIADLSSSDDDDDDEEDQEAKKKFKRAHNDPLKTLRIREDTVKYLRKENEGSYDPKTRTWSQAIESRGNNAVDLADNFVKWTGEAPDLVQMQVFAWDAHSKGVDLNLQADPTKAELLRKELDKKQKEQVKKLSKDIQLKYGDQAEFRQAPLPTDSREISMPVPLKGGQQSSNSRIGEDGFEKYAPGHTSVWGSYFDITNFEWGYSCCKSVDRDRKCSAFK